MPAPVKFRFDAGQHEYIHLESGLVLPHITGMLESAGLVDDLWFTEESSERGTCVHKLTADYDLGALTDLKSVVSVHKGYLAGHVAAMQILMPEILSVEVPRVHPRFLFGGRLDRSVRFRGVFGTLEIKSAVEAKSHRIQTALQAILLAAETALDAEMLGRWVLYLKPNGKWKLVDHNEDRLKAAHDMIEARRIVRMCCGEGLAA